MGTSSVAPEGCWLPTHQIRRIMDVAMSMLSSAFVYGRCLPLHEAPEVQGWDLDPTLLPPHPTTTEGQMDAFTKSTISLGMTRSETGKTQELGEVSHRRNGRTCD